MFAKGQILNGATVRAKQSTKQLAKDNSTLAKLGITTSHQAKALTNNIARKQQILHEKLFNEETNKPSDPKVLRKAVENVSEDLGLKLLQSTPGSLQLLKHFENESLPKHEVKQSQLLTRDEELKVQRKRMAEHQKQAQKLLVETKAQKPMLGRGFSGSKQGFLDLSSPISNKNAMNKAKALEILKGKSISKSDPNCVMNKKRNRDESDKKVAAVLNPKEEETAGESAAKKQKVIRSFTGEIIDEARMAEIKNAKSQRSFLADEAEVEEEERYFDRLEKKEAMEDKMVNTMEIKAKVVSCSECIYTAYSQSDLCKSKGHIVKRFEAKKRFFECKKCKKRTFAFDKYPKKSCLNCGESAWERTGMMKERKGPAADKLLIRGQEQSFIGAVVSSNQLNIDSLD